MVLMSRSMDKLTKVANEISKHPKLGYNNGFT